MKSTTRTVLKIVFITVISFIEPVTIALQQKSHEHEHHEQSKNRFSQAKETTTTKNI